MEFKIIILEEQKQISTFWENLYFLSDELIVTQLLKFFSDIISHTHFSLTECEFAM